MKLIFKAESISPCSSKVTPPGVIQEKKPPPPPPSKVTPPGVIQEKVLIAAPSGTILLSNASVTTVKEITPRMAEVAPGTVDRTRDSSQVKPIVYLNIWILPRI